MAKTPALFNPVLLKPSTVFCTGYVTEWACPLEKRREAKQVDGNPLPRKLSHLSVLCLSPISPGPARKASLLFFPLLSLTPASYSSIVQIILNSYRFVDHFLSLTLWQQGNSALFDVIKHSNPAFQLAHGRDPYKWVHFRRATQ